MSYDNYITGGCNPGWLAEWDIPCPSAACDCDGCEADREDAYQRLLEAEDVWVAAQAAGATADV